MFSIIIPEIELNIYINRYFIRSLLSSLVQLASKFATRLLALNNFETTRTQRGKIVAKRTGVHKSSARPHVPINIAPDVYPRASYRVNRKATPQNSIILRNIENPVPDHFR